MLTRDTQNVGTSLEVLAPYLPYGIEMRHTLSGEIGRVLTANEIQAKGIFFEQTYYWPFADCLPVLRPFSQLCEPLADRTVPAVELAKLALFIPDYLDQQEFNWELAAYGVDDDDQGQECLSVVVPDGASYPYKGDSSIFYLWANGDVHVHNGPHSNQLAIINYLRRHHFAVGLEPHQYIAKEPTAPAAAPSIEREAHE